jgi:hypothetical protein
MKRATLVIVVLLLATLGSLAQDRALISGDAEDNQDTPVAGVQVTLRNPSLRVERTSTTNSDGYYFFAEVTPAEGYEISVSQAGMNFVPPSVSFDVQVGETRHILPSFVGEKATSPISSLQHRARFSQSSSLVIPPLSALGVTAVIANSQSAFPRAVAFVSGISHVFTVAAANMTFRARVFDVAIDRCSLNTHQNYSAITLGTWQTSSVVAEQVVVH